MHVYCDSDLVDIDDLVL